MAHFQPLKNAGSAVISPSSYKGGTHNPSVSNVPVPILNSFGEVLVSDARYAHHNMSIKALKDAKFSPGLGQSTPPPLLSLSRHSPPHSSALAQLTKTFRRRDRYDDNHRVDSSNARGGNDEDDDDDEDDELVERLRRRHREEATVGSGVGSGGLPLASEPAVPAFIPFDPKTARVEAKVPRAADASLHVPGGGDVKIFSQKLDLSHVQPKVPTARSALNHRPRESDVTVWSESIVATKKRYEAIGSKVPTAESAASYRPSGGANSEFQLPSRNKLNWLTNGGSNIQPTVPSASSAATYKKAGGSIAPVFSEKLTFTTEAQSRAVPSGATAKEAAKYKKRGGDVDVFEWQKTDPAVRRLPPPKKTDEQILHEFFPPEQNSSGSSSASGGHHQRTGSVMKHSHAILSTAFSPESIIARKRRDMLLKMD